VGTDEILAEAAAWYYDLCELYEDEELDPDDHIEVIRRAFTTSDCDDFAWMLNRMTGWQVVELSFAAPQWGIGHHSLVRAPDGRLLDVTGWKDEAAARKEACRIKGAKFNLKDIDPREPVWWDGTPSGDDSNDPPNGEPSCACRLASVIRSLPWPPFDTAELRALTTLPLPGIDGYDPRCAVPHT
jgi:hypothetical protein